MVHGALPEMIRLQYCSRSVSRVIRQWAHPAPNTGLNKPWRADGLALAYDIWQLADSECSVATDLIVWVQPMTASNMWLTNDVPNNGPKKIDTWSIASPLNWQNLRLPILASTNPPCDYRGQSDFTYVTSCKDVHQWFSVHYQLRTSKLSFVTVL